MTARPRAGNRSGVKRSRSCDVVTLGVVDPELSQEHERLCVLDPLTDRLQGECPGERDDGLDDVAAGRVAREVADELDIDLQIVDRESLEKGEAAVTGA